MTIPLILLAVLSAGAGFLGMPGITGVPNVVDEWLAPVFAGATGRMIVPAAPGTGLEIGLMLVSVALAAAGILYARRRYAGDAPDRVPVRGKVAYALVLNAYYVDVLYDRLLVRPLNAISERLLWRGIDAGVIDGLVNGLAGRVGALGDRVRRIQTGLVQTYAVAIVAGFVIFIGWLALR